jgi:hypothetical protein
VVVVAVVAVLVVGVVELVRVSVLLAVAACVVDIDVGGELDAFTSLSFRADILLFLVFALFADGMGMGGC